MEVTSSTAQHRAFVGRYPRSCRWVASAFLLAIGLVAAGCEDRRGQTEAMATPQPHLVPKAKCGPGDRAETALQGQVPAALRRPGSFPGFNCNLELVGQNRGEGAGWQSVFFRDRTGHLCAYYDTSPPTSVRKHTGVVVIDATAPTDPVVTDHLTSPAMLDPMETLKVNAKRQVLAAVHSISKERVAELALYDLSADCRFPRLMSSGSIGPSGAPGAAARMNEGAFSPDGFTYYATNLRDGLIDVIDLKEGTNPKVIAEWAMPFNQRTSGIAVSGDGRRAYITLYGQGAAAPTSDGAVHLTNGLIIADVSEVDARREHPQARVVSSLVWGDGSASHQMLPVKINGRDYLIAVDEGGSGYANSTGWKASCSRGLPPWSMARIIDIGDEKHPTVIAKLQLEMNDSRNCNQVLPDVTGLSGFTYGSHYCSVDDEENATAMACAYFESGIRVFDIRDPARPREIAYYVPPIVTSPSPASFNTSTIANGRPDHCSAQTRFDKRGGTLMTTCQDNGFLVLKFTNRAWPFMSDSAAGMPRP